MDFVLPGVVKIPRRNALSEGAMLEPVNTVLKAVRQLALLKGDTVLVAGQGPIGLMFTRLLTLRGMKVLATDLIAERLSLAGELGAVWTGAPGENAARAVERLTSSRGLDAAVIAVPSDDAVKEGQGLLRGGGELMLFAHTRRGSRTELDLSTVCVDEKSLLGSYSSDFTLQREVARLVFSRKIDMRRWITHQFPLEGGAEAVALASRPASNSLKVMVCPDL
jgi:L-iditol 2-dehydrogenase